MPHARPVDAAVTNLRSLSAEEQAEVLTRLSDLRLMTVDDGAMTLDLALPTVVRGGIAWPLLGVIRRPI